jgi:hypothetical protein
MTPAALALVLVSTAARAETAAAPAGVSTTMVVPVTAAPASPTPPFFDVNKYRADPDNPGAIRIPGTNVAIYVGGFAQLDVIGDVNVIGNPDQFEVASIPVGGGTTGNTGSQLSARQSRVFIETDAPWNEAELLAYVEVDFFDPQNLSDLHIRHAFGAVGLPGGVRLVVGQTWTTFMDATVFPSQLDYAAPVGVMSVQQPQARLLVPFHRASGPNGQPLGFEWLLSVEAPAPQITIPMGVTATPYAHWPDAITGLRWTHGHGHLFASALFRQVGILPAAGARQATVGYGGNFTGRLSGFWGKDEVLWSIGGGRAIARYFNGTGGFSLDGFLQPDGQLSVTSSVGGMLSYQHFFAGDRFSLTAIASLVHLYDLEAGSDTTLKQLGYYGAALQYFPNRRLMFGLEYLYGRRENRNDASAADNRLQVSSQVRF